MILVCIIQLAPDRSSGCPSKKTKKTEFDNNKSAKLIAKNISKRLINHNHKAFLFHSLRIHVIGALVLYHR